VLKCLWISRDLPFPQDAGDRIYSANMARSLQEAGVHVRFLGYGDAAHIPADWPLETIAIEGDKHSSLRALCSRAPIAAAIHATPAYRAMLATQLREHWDVIVLDSYGSGWALDEYLRVGHDVMQETPALVYLSHNHEERLWRSMAHESQAALPRRLLLWQNYLKVRALERRLVREADLIATITPEDADSYTQQIDGKRTVVLTPGYSGRIAPEREIDASCPQRVVLVGSFRWVVKQENLRRFLELADARFQQRGIGFDVIGDVPGELLDDLKTRVKATRFHGFVDDIGPFFATSRMAVVPEVIGGGFKLKYLDYIFGRVPVATISDAAAGLPATVRANMLCRENLTQLVDGIVDAIDKPEKLNVMQKLAFAEARAHFQWQERGMRFRQALESIA
jgi:polysaccharide biosynthesis protein PslH